MVPASGVVDSRNLFPNLLLVTYRHTLELERWDDDACHSKSISIDSFLSSSFNRANGAALSLVI